MISSQADVAAADRPASVDLKAQASTYPQMTQQQMMTLWKQWGAQYGGMTPSGREPTFDPVKFQVRIRSDLKWVGGTLKDEVEKNGSSRKHGANVYLCDLARMRQIYPQRTLFRGMLDRAWA